MVTCSYLNELHECGEEPVLAEDGSSNVACINEVAFHEFPRRLWVVVSVGTGCWCTFIITQSVIIVWWESAGVRLCRWEAIGFRAWWLYVVVLDTVTVEIAAVWLVRTNRWVCPGVCTCNKGRGSVNSQNITLYNCCYFLGAHNHLTS